MLRYTPLILLCFLLSLFFINNIAPSGDNSFVSQESIFEDINPHVKSEIGGFDKKINIDYEDFEKYLSNLGNKPLHYTSRKYMDTTGDGEDEVVITEIKVIGQTCLVRNSIEKGNKVIWNDNLILNDDHVKQFIGEGEFVDSLLPYSLFYLGMKYSDFTEKLPVDGLFEHKINQFNMLHHNNSQQNNTFNENSEFRNHLTAYSGVYVYDLNIGNPGIHVWDEKSYTFIKIVDSKMKAS
jgi:hypothetical protein